MRKRNRACEQCHRLKIKCDLGTALGGVCGRCNRSNLDCVPAAPRLQRDRISELEVQIQELRNKLQDQSSSTNPHRSPSTLLDSQNFTILSFLDDRIPLSQQQNLLHLYRQQAGAAWPVICLSMSFEELRAKSPILLLSVLVYCDTQETQGTELDVHDELVRETMHILGDEVIGRGQRSLELVQALLIAAFWSKTTRRGQQGSCYQLIQLASDMAIDLGIAGFSLQPSPVAYFCRHEDTVSVEARRTWLACFVALSASSISTRRSIAVPWSLYHQECLWYLESRGESSDILLCQIVRIIQLIQEISDQLCLCQPDTFVDGNNHSTHDLLGILKNRVDEWAAQIPPSLASSPTLKVFRSVAMITIYEVVLHTTTNKTSFAAPFIPGRIPIKDFPKPENVIPPLRTALEAIIQNCHAVIDTTEKMDPGLLLSLPTFCFSPTVLYALFVLVTVLVTVTDPANTYGQYLTKETIGSFRINQCGLKLRKLTAQLKSLDPTLSCYTTRMFDATGWLEEWYHDYAAILRRYETNLNK